MIQENNAVSIDILHPGAVPIALSLARVAGIREIVEQTTGWKPNNKSTSPGILAESLVAALLCGCRPLYKVEHFWQENKVADLFYKNEGISGHQLNDDAYARMLDLLASLDCRRLFESICLQMLQYHGLDIILAHSDTTSVSVEGIYAVNENGTPSQETVESGFTINHGHSKDRRPDLKQFKIGLSVQEKGLPLSGELLSGNESDQNWNPQTVEELSQMLLNNGYENVIFLADCALISTQSLKNLAERNVQFISRFPETFKLAGELKTQAWTEDNWEDIGVLAENKQNAAYYKTWRAQREIEGKHFDFVVVHSSNLEERKEKTLRKSVEKLSSVLKRRSEELAKKDYACETDAQREGQRLQAEMEEKGFCSELYIKHLETTSYGRRGRPAKGTEATKRVTWRAEVKIGEIKADVYDSKKKQASTFVLIHRLKDGKGSEEILMSYKNQDKVEQGFRFMKQPQYLGPIYTKKPSRVEALGYIFLLVLLLAKYLEYRVRLGMERDGGELKIGGQKVLRPSAKTILEVLNAMLIYSLNGELKLPGNVAKDALDVIRWAGFNEQIYIHGYTGDHFL
jgi:transposase